MAKKIIAATTLGLAAALTVVMPTHAAQASTDNDVRVASFNIQNVSVDQTKGQERPWADRRDVVASEILGENADVVGLQEASPSHFWASHLVNGYNQYMDLKHALNSAGGNYRLTNQRAYNCVNSKTSYKCVHKRRRASNSDRILYNANTVEMVSQGAYKYKAQPTGKNPRYLAWAVLKMKATGSEFLFTTTHLDPLNVTTRKAEWRELIAKVNKLKGSRPVISVGDFNTQKNSPWAANLLPAMHANGYGDVLNQHYHVNPTPNPDPRSKNNTNRWINSFNHENRDVKAYSYDDARTKTGNGIDWIFATNALPVQDYKVVLNYDPQTLQVIGTLPSDHNMIRATITLP
jgi:endonuclease/exonuclease/phosphatase family metal-dependent hydrolase